MQETHPANYDRQSIQRRTLGVLGLSTIATRGALSAVFTVSSLAIKEIMGSSTWAGLSTVATTLGAAASAAALAAVMQRRGRRPGIALGYVVAVVGGIIAVLGIESQRLSAFLGGLLLVGVGSGAVNLARYAAADLAEPEKRSRDISLVIFASVFGGVAGSSLVGFAAGLGEDAGLNERSGAVILCLLLFAVGAAIISLLLRPDPLVVSQGLGIEEKQAGKSFGQAMRLIFARPMARLALVALVISQAVMVMVMAMTPLHMEAHGHELGNIGFVISAHTAGMFAFAPVAGWCSDRFGRVPMVFVSGVILMVATVISALATNAPNLLMYPSLYLLGLGWSFGIVAGSALLTESVDSEDRVAVQGAGDVAARIASGIAALASGIVFEMTGFHILSMIGIVMAGLMLVHAWFEIQVPPKMQDTRSPTGQDTLVP